MAEREWYEDEPLDDAQEKLRQQLGSSYAQIFGGPPGELVLADLEAYCYGNETTASTDPHTSYLLMGRREVWLFIQRRLRTNNNG